MSLRVLEIKWKTALNSILDELTPSEQRKLLFKLDEIPEGQKTEKHKEELADVIIKSYGTKESISVIDREMKVLPRNDAKVQDLLHPFVEKEMKEQETRGKKRNREKEDGLSTDVTPKLFNTQNQQKSSQANNERNTPASWKKSICDLKSSGILATEGFVGKVIQKSALRPYQTKEKAKKGFFHLAVADETASVKVKVYGKDLFKVIEEKNSYLFSRCQIIEENVVMVTTSSKVSLTKAVAVPEELEVEARGLIYPQSLACSIEETKSFSNETNLEVKGTVTEIDPVKKVKVNYQRLKVKQQRFQLKDETGSIWIVMWNESAVGFCRGLSAGDVIQVSNVKTNDYHGDVSLNSTGFTRVIKLQSVGVKNVRIKISGIKKATKKETQLEAEMDQQLHTLVVAPRLLATTFGFNLAGDLKKSLLEMIPLSADVEIQGNKINTITAASKM